MSRSPSARSGSRARSSRAGRAALLEELDLPTELAALLGAEPALACSSLLTRRLHGDQDLPPWVLACKLEALFALYAELDGVTLPDLLLVLSSLPSGPGSALLRRCDDVLVPRFWVATSDEVPLALERWRALTPSQQVALRSSPAGDLVSVAAAHVEVAPWSPLAPLTHLQRVVAAPPGVREVYFALLGDAALELRAGAVRSPGVLVRPVVPDDLYRDLLDLAARV